MYSSIHNFDTSKRYTINLDGQTIAKNVPPEDVASIVYDLEQNDVNVIDEYWNEEDNTIELLTTTLLDGEDDLY
jgi:Holliday junction resolvasome RuvABC ATP-dependent DNA helicase subunit